MNQEARLKVNENGRVVIPAPFRKALGIKAGDQVQGRLKKADSGYLITQLKKP